MATIPPVISNDVSEYGNLKLITWTLVTTGDVGAPVRLGKHATQTWQVFGTTITALALNGSNDANAPANFAPLRDANSSSLGALAAAGFYSPIDFPLWVQPVLTTGAAVTIALLVHRTDFGGPGGR